jgi:HNH endonuclease
MRRKFRHGTFNQTRVHELFFYDPHTGVFLRRQPQASEHVGDVAGCRTSEGYWRIHVDGRSYFAHRLAWLYMTGKWPKDQIDHINLDGSDNRWGNLRGATNGQNQANSLTRGHNTSGFKGAYRDTRANAAHGGPKSWSMERCTISDHSTRPKQPTRPIVPLLQNITES